MCPTCRTDMGPGKVSRNLLAESIIVEQVEGRNITGDYDVTSAPPMEESNASDPYYLLLGHHVCVRHKHQFKHQIHV